MCISHINAYLLLGREVDKGKYAETDHFIHCEEIVSKTEFLIITNHRLLYVQRNEMFGVWNVSAYLHIYILDIYVYILLLLSPCGRISGLKWTVL